ncbi:uncharacterized protein LOC142344101 [Convolutriloba macropyga]|uniref:uncharacterized protein LOC142344101 n=1 Tax=Convolutriloba macropyga TaxID=536237 RepID=UPI003F5270EB
MSTVFVLVTLTPVFSFICCSVITAIVVCIIVKRGKKKVGPGHSNVHWHSSAHPPDQPKPDYPESIPRNQRRPRIVAPISSSPVPPPPSPPFAMPKNTRGNARTRNANTTQNTRPTRVSVAQKFGLV